MVWLLCQNEQRRSRCVSLGLRCFIGLFRFTLGILPFRKLPLALLTVIVFPYLRDEKTGKGFYDSL